MGSVFAFETEVHKFSHAFDVWVFERFHGVVEIDFPGIVHDLCHSVEHFSILGIRNAEVLRAESDLYELNLVFVLEQRGIESLLGETLHLSGLRIGAVEAVNF